MVAASPFTAWLGIVVLLAGGLGIPLGVPPAPEDPQLANIAPEKCLYYTAWAGRTRPDRGSPNETEQLLSEPEVAAFVSETVNRLRESSARMAQRTSPQAVVMAEAVTPLVDRLLNGPAALYIADVRPAPGVPEIRGGLVVNVKDAQDEVRAALEKLRRQILPPRMTSSVEIGGGRFDRLLPTPDGPVITWGVKGDYFVLGVGEGEVEGVLQRAQTPPPKWLRDIQERFPMERRATLTYTDLRELMRIALPLVQEPDVHAAIEATGLGNLRSYVSVAGLDRTRFVSKTAVDVDGAAKGMLSLLSTTPLGPEDLNSIPAESTVAVAFRLDARTALETVLEMVGQVEPHNVVEFNEGLASLEQTFNLKVRDDVLNSLGDVWHVYTSPREGGLLTGWTAAVTLRDRAKLDEAQQKIVGVWNAFGLHDAAAVRIKSLRHAGHTVYSLAIADGDFPLAPSWCLADDELVFALLPQPIKAYLGRDKNADSLASVPEVARMLHDGDGPSVLAYVDTQTVFYSVYPLVQLGARMLLGQMQRRGEDLGLDLALLPSASSVGKHLRPSVFVKRRTPDGIVVESQHTFPGGNVGATAPVLTAMMLPAIVSARAAAARSQSISNLRQLAIALANHESAYLAWPAAYSTDANGKPLLSWRVQILPFLGEQQLYEQFHFDEPWNSEHNRKLIKLMPAVFKSPGSTSEPGKTNYLGVAGQGGLFVPPKPEDKGTPHPLGTRIGEITDGTSKTVSVVEVSDELAVIWTKPDDFEPDRENPVKGLVGVRPGIFLAVMCDASVRVLSQSIDKTILKALFTKNGGEVVPPF